MVHSQKECGNNVHFFMCLPLSLHLLAHTKLHPLVAQSTPAQCTQQNWLQLERPDQ